LDFRLRMCRAYVVPRGRGGGLPKLRRRPHHAPLLPPKDRPTVRRAGLGSAGGAVPTGARAWRVYDGREWGDGELTAREVA
jgi:hypothetical protein